MVSGDCGAPYDEYRGPGLRAEDKGDCKGSYEGKRVPITVTIRLPARINVYHKNGIGFGR